MTLNVLDEELTVTAAVFSEYHGAGDILPCHWVPSEI